MRLSPSSQKLAVVKSAVVEVIDALTEKTQSFPHRARISAMAWSKTDELLAFGDVDGKIVMLWPSSGKKTMLEWHAHRVGDLCFTQDDAYLLSGGQEAVLVLWHYSSGKRVFMPRLGAAISGISISGDNGFYCLTCADNSVRLINTTTRRLERVFQGLQIAASPVPEPESAKALAGPLLCDWKRGLLVVSGRPGVLQFYDPLEDRSVATMNFSSVNLYAGVSDRPMPAPEIRFVALSSDSSMMATVDSDCAVSGASSHRVDHQQSLKFWRYRYETKEFVLVSRVDRPHALSVTALLFHPSQPVVLSAAQDGSFVMWRQSHHAVAGRSAPLLSWKSDIVGMLRPGTAVTAAAFSPDGSLFSLCYESVLSLWSAASGALLHSFAHVPTTTVVCDVAFLATSTYLFSRSQDRLFCWDLLTGTVRWSTAVRARALAVHPVKPEVALLLDRPGSGKDGADSGASVAVYEPTGPSPVRILTHAQSLLGVTYFSVGGDVESNCFLLGLDSIGQLCALGVRSANSLRASHQAAATRMLEKEQERPAVFQAMLHPEVEDIVGAGGDEDAQLPAPTNVAEHSSAVFDGPSYLLPSISTLLQSILPQMLQSSVPSSVPASVPASISTPSAAGGLLATRDATPALAGEGFDSRAAPATGSVSSGKPTKGSQRAPLRPSGPQASVWQQFSDLQLDGFAQQLSAFLASASVPGSAIAGGSARRRQTGGRDDARDAVGESSHPNGLNGHGSSLATAGGAGVDAGAEEVPATPTRRSERLRSKSQDSMSSTMSDSSASDSELHSTVRQSKRRPAGRAGADASGAETAEHVSVGAEADSAAAARKAKKAGRGQLRSPEDAGGPEKPVTPATDNGNDTGLAKAPAAGSVESSSLAVHVAPAVRRKSAARSAKKGVDQ